MLKYVQITDSNEFNLITFLTLYNKKPSEHFRYYDNRTPYQYKKHIYTVLLLDDKVPIAYGHIELDDRYWIAVCVLDEYRGKGHGDSIVKHLIMIANNKRLPSLSLSVDKDNDVALKLYKHHNFKTIHEFEKYYIMHLKLLPSCEVVSIDVSYGDAFDKLAILHIKMNKVSNEKLPDVKREYDVVLSSIAHLFNDIVRFYYKHLIDCSIIIWDKQVLFRSATDNRASLCEEIIYENDRRGKLKNKINKVLSSYIVEQKDGYVMKKAFVSIDGGLEGILATIGMVRYLSTVYDQVLVYTKRVDQFSLIYSDDDTISRTDIDICPEGYKPFVVRFNDKYDNTKYSEIYSPFDAYVDKHYDEIPTCYYKLFGLKEEYFFTYFYIRPGRELHHTLIGKDYIVVQSAYSNIEDIAKGEVIIVDVDNPNSEYYMRDITDYIELLINAKALYLTDSYLYYLALNLELKTEECYYVSRYGKDYSYIYNYLPNDVNRKRFKMMKI